MYVFDSNCISCQMQLIFFFAFDIQSYEAYFISIKVLFSLESWEKGLGIMFCQMVGAAEGEDCKIF